MRQQQNGIRAKAYWRLFMYIPRAGRRRIFNKLTVRFSYIFALISVTYALESYITWGINAVSSFATGNLITIRNLWIPKFQMRSKI